MQSKAMEPKEPVLLVVLIETAKLRWLVAAVGLGGEVIPLLRSEEGDLEKYRGLDFDEQVSFLRHRLSGVLQRGCDRLWERAKKPRQFIFVFEGLLPEPTGELTQAIADHFVLWLLNPPVVAFTSPAATAPGQEPHLNRLAGELETPLEQLLHDRLDALLTASADPDLWDVSPRKPG
jgi:hypothetical protein